MSGLELVPFTDDHLEDAAALLAERHRRHRLVEPLLPARYEDPAQAGMLIEALRAAGAEGVTALRDGALTGYMIGASGPTRVWGENAWVQAAGHAAEESETVRDLYAAIAADWWARGLNRHYALVPSFDPAVLDAWWRVGFGQQHAMALQEVRPQPWPDGVRVAAVSDIDALVELEPMLDAHQRLSPVFSSLESDDDPDEIRAAFAAELADDSLVVLVAEVDGRVAAVLSVVPVERSSVFTGLLRGDGQCHLGFAVTAPHARGSGAGRALTAAGFAWAHARGYTTMTIDWRVTNLLSSRFWTNRGFRPTFLRLYRSLP